MLLGKETKCVYHQFETTMTDKECEMLMEYARKHIVNDRDWLINYAVNKGLEQYIKDLDKTNGALKKMKKSNKKKK